VGLARINRPVELTAPAVAVHETAVFGSLLTVAVNCCVPLAARVAVMGEREILIAEAVARVLSPAVTRTPLASLERTRK
jgi:hypothetical protein